MTINLNFFLINFIILLPLVIAVQAFFYRRKQNGMNPFTGGPISWPKAFWLSYTIWGWFILPIAFLLYPGQSVGIMTILVFHLASWWIRGILELIMIYKWFNWSPRYGISHDLFHWLVVFFSIYVYKDEMIFHWKNFLSPTIDHVAGIYLVSILFFTLAEILFAYLFLTLRTEQEKRENVYFASDDPKWIRVNRITLSVVIFVYVQLSYQSYACFKLLYN